MDTKRLDDIYQNFISTKEYNEKFLKLDYDLSFLAYKLTSREMRRLEILLLSYASAHEKGIFESAFSYAWELFHECQNYEKFNH